MKFSFHITWPEGYDARSVWNVHKQFSIMERCTHLFILLDGGLTIRNKTGDVSDKVLNMNELLRVLKLALELLEVRSLPEVRFDEAVEACIDAKRGRRPRTVTEIRGICGRLMRRVPGLAGRAVSTMVRSDCVKLVQMGSTPRQQHKLRVILHGVFEYCRRQEWCAGNPVSLVAAPLPAEGEIIPLSWEELVQLTSTARLPEHRACMPALGLMLWAGIRPAEVTRLCWADIDWEESVIVLRPAHSKTGGCRHVPLHDVLRRWLQGAGIGQGNICPANWQRRWHALRLAAGLVPWRQDVLRHTYASYHAKHFHDFAGLQESMGHRSAHLLRTRYLSMRGLTAATARRFWQPGAL